MEAIRVDAKYIQNFPSKTVKVIGKLTQYDANAHTGTLEANGSINLKFQPSAAPLKQDEYYEIVATVDGSDNSLKVIEGVDMGDKLNERACNKVVELCHKFPELFYKQA